MTLIEETRFLKPLFLYINVSFPVYAYIVLIGISPFSIQSCRSCYARLYLCQRPFYKILLKVRNSKKIVLKIALIIVNINKDENKSLISICLLERKRMQCSK